jgi:hypothetical protein
MQELCPPREPLVSPYLLWPDAGLAEDQLEELAGQVTAQVAAAAEAVQQREDQLCVLRHCQVLLEGLWRGREGVGKGVPLVSSSPGKFPAFTADGMKITCPSMGMPWTQTYRAPNPCPCCCTCRKDYPYSGDLP